MKRYIIFVILILIVGLKAYCQNEQLQSFLDNLQKKPIFSNTSWAVKVIKSKNGEVVASYNAKQSLIPASTMKILTTGVVFNLMGPEFRFKTTLYYTGYIDSTGVLYGDIIIKGGGDPLLGSYRYRQTCKDTIFKIWRNEISKLGIKQIQGSIGYDASIFDHKPINDTWLWGDIGNYYASGVYGLSFHENMYFAYFNGGERKNDPAVLVSVLPNVSINSFNNVRTGDYGSGDKVNIYGSPFSNERQYEGTVPMLSNKFGIRGALPNPPENCAKLFLDYLEDNHIKVSGGVAKVLPANDKNATLFFSNYSPMLSDIVSFTNKQSNNMYADCMFKYIGTLEGEVGSFESGADAIDKFLRKNNINTKGVVINDGSGLSRQNYFTCDFTCDFLNFMAQQPYFDVFLYSLSETGKSGTLANTLTNAKASIFAKSGTMKGVRSYAGYATNAQGELLCFAVMVNNFTCSQAEVKKQIEELLLLISKSN